MCALIFLAPFTVFIIAASASPVNLKNHDDFKFGDKCTAGEAFYVDCNICVCSEDGANAACTIMKCIDSKDEFTIRKIKNTEEIIAEYKKKVPRVYGYTQGQKCPATSFYNDCNLCICGSDDASAACTAALCPAKKSSDEVDLPNFRHIDEYSQGQACSAGELFYDNCNLCQCSANGLSAACTLMVCSDEDTHHQKAPATEIYSWPHIDGYKPGDSCPSDKMFFDECNICRCNSNGDQAVCTTISCSWLPDTNSFATTSFESASNYPRIDNYVYGDPCPANETFHNQCNLCQCSEDGFSAACTLRFCPLDD